MLPQHARAQWAMGGGGGGWVAAAAAMGVGGGDARTDGLGLEGVADGCALV